MEKVTTVTNRKLVKGTNGIRAGAMALLTLSLILVSGCAALLSPPSVRIVGVELASLGLTSGTAEVTLEVTNQASRGITLSGFVYDLEIRGSQEEAWVQLAEGFHPQELSLAGDEVREVTIPVNFEYRSLGAAVRGFLSRGEIPYRLSGEVRVGGDTLGMDVPFRTEGILRP